MAYDKSKDKEFWKKVDPALEVEVALMSYSGGPTKVEISRWITSKGEAVKIRAGRLTVEEFEFVCSQLEGVKDAVSRL